MTIRPAYGAPGGPVTYGVLDSAANVSTNDSDTVYRITDTSAVRTVTILSRHILQEGRIFIIKDASGGASTNNIQIATEGSETIDGSASNLALQFNYGGIMLMAAGGNLDRIDALATN